MTRPLLPATDTGKWLAGWFRNCFVQGVSNERERRIKATLPFT
jgi:hypothetical protein